MNGKQHGVQGNIGTVLIIFRNEKGIQEIHYPKQNENEEETIIYTNGKTKIAIDYTVEDLKTYEFNVEFEDGTKKTYELVYSIPRIKGNYTLVGNTYVNEPDLTRISKRKNKILIFK